MLGKKQKFNRTTIMVKTNFDFGSFKSLMNELSSNSEKIDAIGWVSETLAEA